MKALFIACSVIAILYLGFQTQIWQHILPIQQVSNSNDKEITSPVFAKQSEPENVNEIIELNKRIDALNKKIEKLEKSSLESVQVKKSQAVVEDDVALLQTSLQKKHTEKNQTTVDKVETESEQLQSEQLKRINQQALLRDLSQKLELSALSSLSK